MRKFDATRCQLLGLNAQNSISAAAYSAPQTPEQHLRGEEGEVGEEEVGEE